MKKFLLFLTIGLCFNTLSGQTIFKDYTDGMLYVKMTRASINNISRENPRNIPLEKLKIFESLLSKYTVTRAFKPFFQASDDANLPYILKIEFKKAGAINSFMEELTRIPGVEYAEKVPLMKADATPNDPTFPAQLTQINAQNAWNVFNGNSNITLAIVDNAVMWTHEDLVANTYTNTGEIAGNSIDDDLNGYVDDVNGWDVADWDNNAIPTNTLMDHGTHCAGIAGARTNNSLGIASIGWNIKIIPVKTTGNGSSTSSIDDGYGGIVYAANAGARVISCSWGGGGFAQSEQNVINYAWGKGCIVVAAAGNSSSTIQSYPGAYGNVYCVASVGSGDIKSGFSNYGTWVDISAPGEGLYSTIPSTTTGTYGFKSGTSMATPMVAGLAALMLSNCSYMTQTAVLNCISTTAVNIYTLSGNSTFSATSQLGAGRIEAFLAMNCATGFLTIAPVANFFAFPLNTCPNTPVMFYDSSLFIPSGTTRSWTIQSGSPSSATSSNVSVQWATPGTYSAALTVSNTNGTNTKTKLSYINVAGPIALPLIEGFQTTPFLPVNWTENNILTDNIYWNRVTGIGGFGTSTACAMFDNYNIDAVGERDEMRTPKYIFSNVVSARLRFDVAYARYNSFYSDTLQVKLSTNCGATWTSIYLTGGVPLSTRSDLTANTFTPTNTQWRTDSVDITALTAGQGNVMFSFINRGHYGQAIYLDNINIAFPTPTINATVPTSVCAGASFNNSQTSAGAASYTWNFPGGSPATSTVSSPSASFATAGLYSVTLVGTNGTTTTSATRTINVIALPVVSVNTPTICNGSVTTLSATGTTNYTWTGFPAGPNLTISPSITTVYTVTGNNGSCSSLKTATVIVNANPTITVNSPTICSGNSAVLTPTGAINYTWTTGTTTLLTAIISPTPPATVIYNIIGNNNLCSAVQTATVFVNPSPTLSINTPTICSGSSAVLTPTGATNYTWTTGTTTLFTSIITPTPPVTVVYNVTGSNGLCSTVQNATVFVNPTPTLSSVTPTICTGTIGTITVSGANSYLWNTSVTTSTMAISVTTLSPPGYINYTVTGTSLGCSTTKTVSAFVESTPSLTLSITPGTVCVGVTTTLSASGANTYTWGSTTTGAIITSSIAIPGVAIYPIVGTNSLCSASSVATVLAISAPPLNVSSQSLAICMGDTVTLVATGSYTNILWSTNQTNSTAISPSVSTTYTVVGSGYLSTGCITSSVVSVVVNPVPVSTISFTNASCTNSCSGIANAVITGGTAPFISNLSNGCSTFPCSNLCVGAYTLSTKNFEGCSSESTFTITAPVNNLSLSSLTSSATCSTCATGSGSVTVTGGLAPYSYSWSPSGGNLANGSGLLPGCYTVSVTDANKCPSQTSLCVGFFDTTGLNAIQTNQGLLLVYPNPAQNQVTIDYNGIVFGYRLYNSIGQLVKEKQDNQNTATVNLESLAKGVYVIEVRSGTESSIRKLVIE